MATVIEAVENAVQFLESLGYVGGDIHDDLAQALAKLKLRKARRDEMAARAKQWAAGVPPEFRLAEAMPAKEPLCWHRLIGADGICLECGKRAAITLSDTRKERA